MKQHITVEQLSELSKKGLNTISKWAEKYNVDNKMDYSIWHNDGDGVYFPLPTIGQMIEFLDEHEFTGGEILNYWSTDGKNGGIFDFKWSGELVDILWEAVKEVLEAK